MCKHALVKQMHLTNTHINTAVIKYLSSSSSGQSRPGSSPEFKVGLYTANAEN